VTQQTAEHPSLSSVVFDTADYQDVGVQDGTHVWHTPQGDGVGLFFFQLPPDLPKNARSEDELRQAFSTSLADDKLVELRLLAVDGQRSVQTIIKAPQQPSGMTYVGSIIIPFRDFSFVLKSQCQEGGMTGMREAILLSKMLAKGDVVRDDAGFPVRFSPDDPEYDAQFPKHPLSRLRSTLQRFEQTVRLNESVKKLPPFELPEKADE
jgi:hypothetical protein